MKKNILAWLLACILPLSTFAAVTDLSQLDSSKSYLIHNTNDGGYIIYNAAMATDNPYLGGVNTTWNNVYDLGILDAIDTSLNNCHWQIRSNGDGGYYLYNVGAGKYMAYGGSYNYVFSNTAVAFTIEEIESGVYALTASPSDTRAYVCAASQNDNPISSWEKDDPGSCWELIEASDGNEYENPTPVPSWRMMTGADLRNVQGSKQIAISSLSTSGMTWQNFSSTTTSIYSEPQESDLFTWSNNGDGTFSLIQGEYSYSDLMGYSLLTEADTYGQTYSTLRSFSSCILSSYAGNPYIIRIARSDGYSLGSEYSGYTTFNTSTGGWNTFYVFDMDSYFNVVSVEDISITGSVAQMNIGQTLQLGISYTPTETTQTGAYWNTSNASVLQVTSSGYVTAVGVGTATITATSPYGPTATVTIKVIDPTQVEIIDGGTQCLYVYEGTALTVIPKGYISTQTTSGSNTIITTIAGEKYTYPTTSVKTTAPSNAPYFTSYKFNNKFNEQVFTDAIADSLTLTTKPSTIDITVGGIGKWLTASFKLSDDYARAYVGEKRQRSKETRQRFDDSVTYTIGYSNWKKLQIVRTGDAYETKQVPYGRETTVRVEWLCDNPTNTSSNYGVPRIDITLATVTVPTSKTEYVEGSIVIDGAGVYPDMARTTILIKGRGNTSWSSSSYSKNPYHFKFLSKQKPLGMTAGKHWILLANKQDGSMTTNAIGHKIADQIDCAAAMHIVPVELYINGSYRGSYNLTEKIGFANNSIDILDESAAAILELDSYTDETIYTSNAYSLKTKINKPDFTEEDLDRVITADDVIGEWDNFVHCVKYSGDQYKNYVDVDYLARYLMANEYMANCELKHPKSVFLYNENVLDGFAIDADHDETPWIFGPIWDCDWAFGYEQSYSYYENSAESDFFGSLLSGGDSNGNAQRMWKALRYNSTEVDKAYYYLWYNYVNNGGLDEIIDYCDDYYNFAASSFTHNKNNECSERDRYSDYAQITENCKEWLITRARYILSTLNTYELPVVDDDDDDDNFLIGDVNGDGVITTADVVCILNNLLGRQNETFITQSADIDSNGNITIGDLVQLVNLVMEQPANTRRNIHLAPSTAAMQLVSFSAKEESEATLPLLLSVDEGQYCGLQFDVQLPEGFTLTGIDLPATLQDMKVRTSEIGDYTYRVSIYADGGHLFPEDVSNISLLLVTGTAMNEPSRIINVNNALLSTSLGEEERLAASTCRFTYINDATTEGIKGITNDNTESESVIYDLQGRRINKAQGGIYITNNHKVLVK